MHVGNPPDTAVVPRRMPQDVYNEVLKIHGCGAMGHTQMSIIYETMVHAADVDGPIKRKREETQAYVLEQARKLDW